MTARSLPTGPDGPDTRSPHSLRAPHDGGPKALLGLSLSQLAGSALAAVTTAVAASFLGVAGTLIGAAFGSVVSTIAGAAYATSLKTAATRVRTTRAVLVRPGPDAVRDTSQTDPGRVPTGLGADSVEVSAVGRTTTYRSRPRVTWKPVAVLAALGFVLGIGLLSLTEGLLGHPVSGSEASGTTIGTVIGGGSGTPPAGAPSPAATDPTTSPTTSPSGSPTGSPSAPDGATTAPPGSTTSAATDLGPTDRPSDAVSASTAADGTSPAPDPATTDGPVVP